MAPSTQLAAIDHIRILRGIADEFENALVGKISIRFAFFEWLETAERPDEKELKKLPAFENCQFHRMGMRRSELSYKRWTHRPNADWEYYFYVPQGEFREIGFLLDKFSDLLSKTNAVLDMVERLDSPRIAAAPRDQKLVAAFLDTLKPLYYGLCQATDLTLHWVYLGMESPGAEHVVGAWVTDDFARHAAASLRYVADTCICSGPTIHAEIPVLAAIDASILQALSGRRHAIAQEDISTAAGYDRKLVGQRLKSLREFGLVDHPPGKERLYGITHAGRKLIGDLVTATT